MGYAGEECGVKSRANAEFVVFCKLVDISGFWSIKRYSGRYTVHLDDKIKNGRYNFFPGDKIISTSILYSAAGF
ncbi:hypothetical protein A6P54_04765 [Bacillus sp. MKU004]|nr:hypothetical protein A6P54_04765 [Bacillus sp. MKU004]